ncbi:MAG: universal stress protein [Thermoplasmata archaeon]
MYERVIIPTDGSKCAEAGGREGIEAARALGIKAIAIYVVDASEYEGVHHHAIRNSVRAGFKQKGIKTLKKLKEYASKRGVKVDTKIKEGKPYFEISELAGENDIIYISSHGASGFTKMFIGSTTDKVLKNARCTVAVVKGGY